MISNCGGLFLHTDIYFQNKVQYILSFDNEIHCTYMSKTVSGSNKTSDRFLSMWLVTKFDEKDVLFSNDTGNLGKRNSECSYQEST